MTHIHAKFARMAAANQFMSQLTLTLSNLENSPIVSVLYIYPLPTVAFRGPTTSSQLLAQLAILSRLLSEPDTATIIARLPD